LLLLTGLGDAKFQFADTTAKGSAPAEAAEAH
jgi:hypothetical protein